jgi:hypothetical protein
MTTGSSPVRPAMKNKKFYLLNLTGIKDHALYLITKEMWDWVTSKDMGQRPEDKKKSSWEDTIAPERAIKENEEPIYLTRGSWDNDRALQCPIEESFSDITSLMKYCKQHHITIVDEYKGCIY